MRHTITLSFLALAFVCVLATPAMADPIPWEGSGAGDFNGQRTRADDEFGITFWWLQDIHAQQNVQGGISKGGAAFSRSMLALNYQFEPLTPLKGTEFQVSAAWNVGGQINDHVGALLSPTTIFRPNAIRLYELYLGQSFADGQVKFIIGRVPVSDMTAGTTPLLLDFMSPGYDSNPGAFFLNQPVAAYLYPVATWGARIKFVPKKQDFEIYFGAYNGTRGLDAADKRGVDFSLNLKESVYLMGEFAYKLNQDPEDPGLPGNYKIGALYDSFAFTRLDNSTQTENGNPGWYLVVDQMLFRERPPAAPTDSAKSKSGERKTFPPDQGLYGFANFVMHPKKSINISPYWVSAGLVYKGPIPHRDADHVDFAFYYASLSPDSALSFEFQFEFIYRFQLTPWFMIGPDLQYFKNPGGGQVKDAVVVGIDMHFAL